MKRINDVKWKMFHLSDLFEEITRGKISDLRNADSGMTLIVAAAGVQEGFSCFTSDVPCARNAMTISFNGVGTGTAFVHDYSFNLNSDCGLVKPVHDLSVNVLRFIAVAINMNKEKFNYGYKANENRLLRQSILLPVDCNDEPDYDFMDSYIREKEQEKKSSYLNYCNKQLQELGSLVVIDKIEEKDWKSFYVKDIFDKVERGKRLKKEDHIKGNKPYVSSTASNNGVDQFIGNEKGIRVFDDCLSLANSGSVGACFYEPFQFIASDHVTHLKRNDTSKFIYLFMAAMLNRLSEKYNFNREINDFRINREKILLPVTDEGEPDYDFMEQYAKNLMIKKYTEYLDYLQK